MFPSLLQKLYRLLPHIIVSLDIWKTWYWIWIIVEIAPALIPEVSEITDLALQVDPGVVEDGRDLLEDPVHLFPVLYWIGLPQ